MTDIAVIDPSLHAEAGGDRQQNNDHAGVAEKSAAAGTAGEAFERSEADAAQQQGSEAHSGSFEVVGRNQSATSLAEVTSSKLHVRSPIPTTCCFSPCPLRFNAERARL